MTTPHVTSVPHAGPSPHAPVARQTPEQYAQEIFNTLRNLGAPYGDAMREARKALADARADDYSRQVRRDREWRAL